MSLDIRNEKGVTLDKQVFTWREFGGKPYSKLDDDAFTRVRVILMNGVESEAVRFSHACARMNRDLRIPLARVRRTDADRLVRAAHVQRGAVRFRVDGHGREPELAAGADDANRDLAPVRYEHPAHVSRRAR